MGKRLKILFGNARRNFMLFLDYFVFAEKISLAGMSNIKSLKFFRFHGKKVFIY